MYNKIVKINLQQNADDVTTNLLFVVTRVVLWEST